MAQKRRGRSLAEDNEDNGALAFCGTCSEDVNQKTEMQHKRSSKSQIALELQGFCRKCLQLFEETDKFWGAPTFLKNHTHPY